MSSNKKEKRKEIKRYLCAEFQNEWKSLILGSLAMLGSAAANQAVPKLLGKVLDHNASGTSNTEKYATGLINDSRQNNSLLLIVLGGGMASFIRTTMLNRAQDSIASRLRKRVFAKLMHHDVTWYQISSQPLNDTDTSSSPTSGKSTTEIQSILTKDVTTVSELVSTLANTFRSSCSVIFATRNMLAIDPHLLSISIGVVPLIGSAAVVLNKFVKKIVQKQRDIMIQSECFAMERVDHVDMVKISSREEAEIQRFDTMQNDVVQFGRMASWAKGLFMGFMFSASSAALVTIFQVGGKDVAKGTLSHGELKSFATYTFMLGLGTSGVMKGMGAFMQGMLSAERVYDLLQDEESIDHDNHNNNSKNNPNDETLMVDPSTVHGISVENVSFSYASNPSAPVLRDVTMKVDRGEVVAILGKNGAGKSTLSSLLVALQQPTSGSISVHTHDTSINFFSLDRKTQSNLVQLVPQQPCLFNMSIEDNVKYTNPSATEEEVDMALDAANCKGFISNLADGVKYVVGRNGEKLSGGQKQRVALARALLSNPALLILDEPNSSMDAEGDEAVADAVKACRDGKSGMTQKGMILISHRAASLKLADTIIVLKDGVVVEEGTYSALSKNKKSELCQLIPELQ
jgi:ABC-type multidrug transport system fused ATPase/permease subunit